MRCSELDLNYRSPAYSPAEIAVLVNVAAKLGVPASSALHQTGLVAAKLGEPQERVSLRQHMATLLNVVALTTDRYLPVRAGTSVHLSAFGIAGYAVWNSISMGSAVELAAKYGLLLDMKCGLELSVSDCRAVLHFVAPEQLSANEHQMCVEMEVAKVVTFLYDLHVKGFAPNEIHLPCSDGDAFGLSAFFGCEVIGNSEVAKIIFDASWLQQQLAQFNPMTNRSCKQACNELLNNRESSPDLVTRIRAILSDPSGAIQSLPEIANTLCLSPRTLRRRLETMGTSYSEILDGVRKNLAIHLISTTRLTTEIIAERLDYSDAANFSHAFKRWTGEAPRQFRTRFTADGNEHAEAVGWRDVIREQPERRAQALA